MKSIKIKVVSEGLGRKVKFYDAHTDEELIIEGVKDLQWEQGMGTGILTVNFIDFELVACGVKRPHVAAGD